MSRNVLSLKNITLALTAAALTAMTTGCAMDPISLSGPAPSPVTVPFNISGTVHGGQNPVSYSKVQIATPGTTGYGSLGTALTTKLTSSTNQYYPGGTTGCNTTNVNLTAYVIAAGTATFTASNTMIVGQLVTVNDGGASGISGTYPVTARTSTTFSVATALGAGAGTTTGSATPTCYNNPTSDINGNFTITGDYTCSTGASALVFLIASGGNPGISPTTNNSALDMIAPLGTCGSPYPTVVINEVTTAATAFALGQYFTTSFGGSSSDTFGAPSTTQGQVGITNAFNTIANLVTASTGAAVTSNVITNTVGSVTITPESAKLNTIADVLAACVNSTGVGTPCSTLFADVVPTGTTTPTDTLQAAVLMSLNPTSNNANGSSANMTALYGLAQATGAPFTGLGAQPTDWTLGITYGSNSTLSASGNYLITDPEHVAVDAAGNIWLENFGTTSTGNSVTELSPTGTPLVQALTSITGTSGNVTIDPSGNVWVPNPYGPTGTSGAGTTVTEYTTGGATNTFTTGNDPTSIAFDGLGNAFVLEPSFKNTTTASGATGTAGTLEEIPVGSTSGTLATTIATNVVTDFSVLAVDNNYTIWVAGGGTATTGTGTAGLDGIFQFLKNSGTGTGYPSAATATAVGTALAGTTTIASITEPESLSIDSSGNVWTANYSKSTLAAIAGTSTTTLAAAAGTPFATTGDAAPEFIIMDGGGNIWMTQASTTGTIFAYSNTGTALGPAAGFAHTYSEPYGIAVDPSGNVWVGNEKATASSTVQGFVTEIVGAAVPVVTPIAAGLPTTKGGTNKLGTKP